MPPPSRVKRRAWLHSLTIVLSLFGPDGELCTTPQKGNPSSVFIYFMLQWELFQPVYCLICLAGSATGSFLGVCSRHSQTFQHFKVIVRAGTFPLIIDACRFEIWGGGGSEQKGGQRFCSVRTHQTHNPTTAKKRSGRQSL